MVISAAANIDDDDDVFVQPKSFAPITSSSTTTTTNNVSPSPKNSNSSIIGIGGRSSSRGRNTNLVSEGGGGGGGGMGGRRYYSSSSPKSSSPATPRTSSTNNTSTKLGLSLRRITPASSVVAATPSPSPRAQRRRNMIMMNNNASNNNAGGGGNDGQQSTTTGSSSLVSRITGTGKYSIATGATPVMRGGGGQRGGGGGGYGYGNGTGSGVSRTTTSTTNNNGSGGNPPALKKRSVDRRQRMEDEYYRPSMHWEEEDEEDDDNNNNNNNNEGNRYYNTYDDDEDGEEVDEEYNLPRLMIPPPPPTTTTTKEQPPSSSSPSAAATAAAATAAAAMMMPALIVSSPPSTNQEQQLKVAGFWSQLDDNGADDESSEEEDDDDIPTVTMDNDDDDDDDDDDEEEEMPGDEREHWRKGSSNSASPPRRNRKNNNRSFRNRFGSRKGGGGGVGGSNDNDTSIGLDLVRRPQNSDKDDEYYDVSKSQQQQLMSASNKNNGSGKNNNWNLLEKAACFANNENKSVGDENDDNEESTGGGGGTVRMEEEDEDQSLDRKFQSSSGRGTTNTTTTTATRAEEEDDEENTVLACITGALATICGYEAATNLVSPNKKRAHDIIDKKKKKRNNNYYDDDDDYDEDDMMTNMTDEEDAAIELQYHHSADQAAGSGGGGGGGGGDGSLPLSPRRKLAFKKLLSLGKKKKGSSGMESPTRKTLVTTTTRSGRVPAAAGGGVGAKEDGSDRRDGLAKTRLTDMNSSMTFEQEILGIDDDDEAEEPMMVNNNKLTAIDEGTAAASSNVIPNNDEEEEEEELESEAAAWSTNKKNSYLRQLAERAKMEYSVNNATAAAAAAGGTYTASSSNDKSVVIAGVAVGAAAAAAAVAATSRSAAQHQDDNESMVVDEPAASDGEQASYNADYTTFSPAQKRVFLRLLNSGMSPQDAARRIAQESSGGSVKVVENDNIDDDDKEEGEEAEEDTIMEDDNRNNVSSGTEMPSFSKMPSLRYPDDEDNNMPQLLPQLMSVDPPEGDVVSDAAAPEETTDNDDRENNIHSVSRSEMAQDESRSNSQGRHAALASIPMVPALIRAKLRSKSKERKREQYPTLLQQDEDGEDAMDVDEGQAPQDAPVTNNGDGLVSSGIGYYDAHGRGLDRNEEDNEFDDDNADSGLLVSESSAPPSTRGRSQKQKFLGVAGVAASGLAAKVASSRQVGVPRKRGLRYRSVDTSLANPVTMTDNELDDVDDTDPSTDAEYDQEGTKQIKSPRPVSSAALHFMNRNPTKTSGSSKQWTKLDSDMALDQVAPSRSVEVEDMPSWLVSRDGDEVDNVELVNDNEGEEEIAGGEDVVSDALVGSTEGDQAVSHEPPMWSSSINPEMDHSQMRNATTPTSPDSTNSVVSPHGELESEEREGEEHQNVGEGVPFPPPVSPVSPDEDATSIMDRSYASTMAGSTWTSTSKSHRKRHKGAASKRILQAKEAGRHNKSKGWLDSIRDAASMQGQIWDPERGWVDYTEPEDLGGQERDYFSPGSLHISIPSKTKAKTEDSNDSVKYGEQYIPEQPTQERDTVAIQSDKSAVSSPADASVDGEDTIFDAMTVNSAAEGMSVYSHSTAAPKRRAVPRHRPTDQRKISAVHQDTKPIGWKESMESATANVAGRYWDYERGWVRADGTVDDDVSELTRSTLEGVKMLNQGSRSLGDNSGKGSERSRVLLQNQHDNHEAAWEESMSPSHLPSVAEEDDNAAVEEDHNDDDIWMMDHEDHTGASRSMDPNDDDPPGAFQQTESVILPSIVTAGSDKENQTSAMEVSAATPPLSAGDQRAPSLPISNNKRTLNQWLEKSNKEESPKLDESEVAAVMSHESRGSSFSNHIEDNINPFSNTFDSFGEFESGAQEVEVVKEKCTDADSDLFEPSNTGISRSLINKLSEGISAASRQNSIRPQMREPQPVIKSFKPQDSNESSSWIPPPPPTHSPEEEHQRSADMHGWSAADSLQTAQVVSSRAHNMSSVVNATRPQQQASAVTEESSTTELDSNAPQVNTAGAPSSGDDDASSSLRISGIQNLDPPKSRTPRSGTRNVKKASDSWIQNKKDLESENEQAQVAVKESSNTANSYVGSLRSKFESKGANKSAVTTNTDHVVETPVFVPTNHGVEENDVYFRSPAMGIRLKRGEDGFVRVVSVTEATHDSSIVRDGAIEPDDRVLEAAGVDLRNAISNNQWGETVTKIRNAPRPMKFVVAAGPKRDASNEIPYAHQPSTTTFPPPPAKYVMESRLSKSPEGQQVLESLSMARSYEVARAVSPPAIQQLINSSTQTAGGGADEPVAGKTVDDEDTQIPPKESLLKRIAAGCASPATVCTAPSTSSQQSQGNNNDEGSQVPMAHLQFLRTNPTIARVANAASRRYPALCGRPDTIFEEPDDDDVTRDTMTTERSAYRDRRHAYGSSRNRSSSSKDDGSQTMATYSTYDDRTAPPIGATYSTGSGSIGSGGTGDNTEFLEKLALGSSIRSNPTNPRRDTTINATIPQNLGKSSYKSQHHVVEDDDLEWPDDGEQQQQEEEPMTQKDTINDGMSTYISSMNQPSYLSNSRKNGSARQAELLAAGKVEDMMNELHNVDPEEECEI